jgi:hypothetical protein
MQKKLVAVAPILASALFLGCGAPEMSREESKANSQSGASTKIQGMFELKAAKGHTETMQGSIVNRTVFDQTFPSGTGSLVQMNIPEKGVGSLEGGSRCIPNIEDPKGLPAKAGTGTLVGGVFSVSKLLFGLFKTFQCDPNKVEISKVFLLERGGFLWRAPSFWANVGVLNESPNSKSGDEECRQLSGYRYFNLNESVVCVGRLSGTKVKMLIQRPGEIHLQRLILQPSPSRTF